MTVQLLGISLPRLSNTINLHDCTTPRYLTSSSCIGLNHVFKGYPSSSWFQCFSISIPHMVMLALQPYILPHIYPQHVMEVMHLNSHPANSSQQPVMEYGTKVQHVGGNTLWGALVIQQQMLVIKTRLLNISIDTPCWIC